MAAADGSSLPEAVRKILDLWINSEEGRRYLLDNYRVDVTEPKTPEMPGPTGMDATEENSPVVGPWKNSNRGSSDA